MLPPSFFDHLGDRLNLAVYDINQDHRMAVTPISRLRDKLSKAAGVAQRVASNIEGEADALIAQEDTIKAKTNDAFAPHHAILAEANTELQAIQDALNLMSNGGPPLLDAEPTAPGSPSDKTYPSYP